MLTDLKVLPAATRMSLKDGGILRLANRLVSWCIAKSLILQFPAIIFILTCLVRQLSVFRAFDMESAACKMLCTITILQLAAGDAVQAQQT